MHCVFKLAYPMENHFLDIFCSSFSTISAIDYKYDKTVSVERQKRQYMTINLVHKRNKKQSMQALYKTNKINYTSKIYIVQKGKKRIKLQKCNHNNA